MHSDGSGTNVAKMLLMIFQRFAQGPSNTIRHVYNVLSETLVHKLGIKIVGT